MAIVFVLALLLDSACTAACIPAELEAPAEHCAPSPERGCDLHVHLKPVVKDRGFVAATTTDAAPVRLESPATPIGLGSFSAADVRGAVLHVPPLLQRSSVLRI